MEDSQNVEQDHHEVKDIPHFRAAEVEAFLPESQPQESHA